MSRVFVHTSLGIWRNSTPTLAKCFYLRKGAILRSRHQLLISETGDTQGSDSLQSAPYLSQPAAPSLARTAESKAFR